MKPDKIVGIISNHWDPPKVSRLHFNWPVGYVYITVRVVNFEGLNFCGLEAIIIFSWHIV